jgi:DNA-directed RNA polymerase specialized sigma54-like protein
MELVEESLSLESKPGRRFGTNNSQYIVPDVFVHKMRGEYTTPYGKKRLPIVGSFKMVCTPCGSALFRGCSPDAHQNLGKCCGCL